MKITVENQAILRRLQDKQPTYSVTKWADEFKYIERIRNNVCEFPYEFGAAESRTRFMMTTAQPEDGNYQSLPRIGGTSQGTRSRPGYNSLNTHSNGTASAGNFSRGLSANNAGQNLPVIR